MVNYSRYSCSIVKEGNGYYIEGIRVNGVLDSSTVQAKSPGTLQGSVTGDTYEELKRNAQSFILDLVQEDVKKQKESPDQSDVLEERV